MYWVILSILTTVESFFSVILIWIPGYAWMRLGLHLYLVMPGQQGATALYQTYIHPFLAEHESEIEEFISDAHERAKQAGLQYLKMALEWIKVNVLGQQPRPPTPPPSRQASYAQQLLSRFNLPTAREGLAAPAGDIYGLLVSALQTVTTSSASRETQVEDLSASGTLIPPGFDTPQERMNYVSRQRENLRVLLQAFDREAFNLAGQDTPRPAADLTKSRSEVDFEKIETEEVDESRARKPVQGGWIPWGWGGTAPEDAGHSSGVDIGR
jgi:receptor expression-enhancing protein 1/2/3/4